MPVKSASADLTIQFIGEGQELLPDIRINEWLALNQTNLMDPADGDFEDWFELFNSGTEAVDLSGFSMTDDLDRPGKWVFPMGTVIEGDGFLLVWADEEPEQSEGNESLHAEFKLNGNGGLIALFTPDRLRIDQVVFHEQASDVSMGRRPEGEDPESFLRFTKPTPGQSNLGEVGFRILDVRISRPDHLMISWESEVGSRYQLQSKDSAISPSWSNWRNPIMAEGPRQISNWKYRMKYHSVFFG